jgi:phosphoribosylamine--glycine ligase
MKRNVLIVGGGAREHALGRKLRKGDPRVHKLYFAPGNAGTTQVGMNVPIAATDIAGLVDFAKKNGIDLVIVGPDDPLAQGIVDAFIEAGIRIFGPTKSAARIESSKAFAKELMCNKSVPTARHRSFTDYTQALQYAILNLPCFIKASGLALGKGAYPCTTQEGARDVLKKIMLDQIHGAAGNEVVIERLLTGVELSVHAMCTKESHVLFPISMDHKTLTADPDSPMTGGMGAVSPVPWLTDEFPGSIGRNIVQPLLAGLSQVGAPFSGCLFPGIMLTEDGPKVLEVNARFGDPETQVLMTLLESPLLDLIEASIDGTLERLEVKWRKGFAACISVVSGGYPGVYEKGKFISRDINPVLGNPNVMVYHAGTAWKDGVGLVTAGGRVLSVTAYDENSLQEAISLAYAAVKCFHFDGMYYREDIGQRALTAPSWLIAA